MKSDSIAAPTPQDSCVLVVDDQQVMRLLARGALEQAGFSVVEAENGRRALDIFDSVRPDLVLLDVQMPVLDGFETCRCLRQEQASRHTPIMMMTGTEDLDAIRHAYEVGATDFVVKPINWLILGHRLGYMLRASRAGQDLRDSRSMLANAQRIASLGYWEWSLDSGEFTCSSELDRIFGVGEDSHMDSFADLLSRIDVADREIVEESVEAALQCEPTRAIEFRLPVGENDKRFVRQRLEAVTADDKSLVRLTGVVQDVTEQRQAEEKIQYLAYYDGLTGLPNRRALDERLELALASAKRSGRSVALLYFDIDRFKRINDTAGHTMGDQLLQGAAARLLQSVRATDIVGRPGGSATEPAELVCRFGGDEFVALLTDLERPEQSAVVARRLMAAMADDFEIDGESIRLTASLGIAAHPEDGATAEMLIRNAAAAVSHCKERGGNQYQFYSESMNTTALEHLVLEAALSKAVGRDEFVLHYQPQYDVTSGRIVGAEALLRWQHRDLGRLTPDKFISLAEETGLIVPIGEWVLQEACRQAVEWQTEDSPLRMSVNVSSRQVLQTGLEEAVQQALADSGLDSSLLELELTESTLLQDKESIRSRLDRIQSLGVGLSIDDFGTGYSALSYLARFPLETLKIDRSFVNGTPGHATNDGICRAIVAMAGSLRLRVIAEGVETEEQLDFLRKEGCFQVQGFLYSRPVSAEAFTKLLQSQAEIQPLTAVGTC